MVNPWLYNMLVKNESLSLSFELNLRVQDVEQYKIQ